MTVSLPRKLRHIVLPDGAVLAALAVLPLWDGARAALFDVLPLLAYAVLGVGLLVGWRFQRSGVVFGLAALALVELAFRALPADPIRPVVAFLLPLNLCAFAFLNERGLLTKFGLAQAVMVGAQAGLVAFAGRLDAPPGLLTLAPLPDVLVRWTEVGQPALLAGLLALAALGARLWLRPGPKDRGFFWAILASVLALSVSSDRLRTFYLVGAGLLLIMDTLEESFALAYRDQLTGLPGRRALDAALKRMGSSFTIAMVDVDRFKRFNDEFGHDAGDQVLRMVARHLDHVNGGGRPYRYGGEEFAILFPGSTLQDATPHLETLRESIATAGFAIRRANRPRKKPKRLTPWRGTPTKRVTITVSIGAAQPTTRRSKAEDVLQAADKALYKAKQKGRNRVET